MTISNPAKSKEEYLTLVSDLVEANEARKNSKLDTATFKKAMRNKKLREQLGIKVGKCEVCNKLLVKSVSLTIPTKFYRYMGHSIDMRDGKELLACKKCYPEHFEDIDATWNPQYTPGYIKAKTELGKTILAAHREQPE